MSWEKNVFTYMNRKTVTKNEYDAMKKKEKKIRVIGFILIFVFLFVCGLILYCPKSPNDSQAALLVFFAGLSGLFCFISGSLLIIISALYKKEIGQLQIEEERVVQSIDHKPIIVENKPQEVPENNTVLPQYKEKTKIDVNNKILGCLFGGAAGDALGYTVEFMSYDKIIKKYGTSGITEYSLDPLTAKALISDDTQMTLFTAEGLLEQDGEEIQNIYNAYKNWLITQTVSFYDRPLSGKDDLMNRPELFSARAPGNTCLSALTFGTMGTVTNPINSSKGCGGIMRVSPIAFLNSKSEFELDKLAAKAAAITHGHPLGYLPAALLVHIIHKTIFDKKECTLHNIVNDSVKEFSKSFAFAPCLSELLAIVYKAIEFSDNKRSDIENIKELGEGWVAEETLAIAVYSALRHSDDFSAAIVAAVNHDGDSDSTGAVTGNILGAYLGEVGIDPKWIERVELNDLIKRYANRFRV